MTGPILLIVPYGAIVVFLIGLIYRGIKIAKMPVHLRWELAPVPHEKGKGSYGGSYLEEFEWWTKKREKSLISEAWYMFQEIIFLKGVWEHNRSLWIFSFPFHFGGFYLLAGMVGLSVLNAILQIANIHISGINYLIAFLAVVGYILGCIGALGLLYRRVSDSEIKSFTTFATIFNLLFLFVIFASGAYAMSKVGNYPVLMTEYVKSLLTADTTMLLPRSFSLHVLLASLFLIYLPFTYMMHFVAKYFTYHEVRWNDEPMEAGCAMEKEVEQLLGQKVTWDAPHIKGKGTKTWVDVATEEVKDA
jgi:nitrate reductase gamma subunit